MFSGRILFRDLILYTAQIQNQFYIFMTCPHSRKQVFWKMYRQIHSPEPLTKHWQSFNWIQSCFYLPSIIRIFMPVFLKIFCYNSIGILEMIAKVLADTD